MSRTMCPCGSGLPMDQCCGPYISGDASAPTAEALMRSRYSAFVLKRSDYLLASWHSTTRPQTLDLSNDDTEWNGLKILRTEAGGEDDTNGVVEFVASFFQGGKAAELQEASHFVREEGCWLYLDGDTTPPAGEQKVGRNAPCPCGSGKKYKRCCGK